MVKLTYNPGCRLGNRLYMYAAGRLLARKLGLALVSQPLEGFPRTRDFLSGKSLVDQVQKLNGADPIPSWPNVDGLRGKGLEIEHGFVNSRYFVEDRNLIKTWFRGTPPAQDPEDVLVNVRLAEFVQLGLALDPVYYTSIIERLTFKRLHLMTDDPGNPYLDVFSKYNPILVAGKGIEHFVRAQSFSRIIMSNSTFCWWFTFVSSALEVYLPMINGNRCGSWCLGHLPSIDLRLDWPEVTHVYGVPNWGSPLPGPTDEERAEAMAFGKHSRAIFL